MSAPITQYTGLVPVANSSQPDFMAMLAVSVQPFADIIAFEGTINSDYDIDTAIGVQLDTLGQLIGIAASLKRGVDRFRHRRSKV